MAGYVMLLNVDKFKNDLRVKSNKNLTVQEKEDMCVQLALNELVKPGIYSTHVVINGDSLKYNIPLEGVLGDYLTMKPGDNIYFFAKRNIFGIGTLVKVGDDCKFKNSKDSFAFHSDLSVTSDEVLINFEEYRSFPMLCAFKPSPLFFSEGIDMDEALTFKPDSYKMLRVMQKVSFIKIDDEENIALRNAILKKNEFQLDNRKTSIQFDDSVHKFIAEKIKKNPENHKMDVMELINNLNEENNRIHEMLVEDMLLQYMNNEENEEFGEWDFITHQYVASPFKPVAYIDKMDIFGYRYIKGFKGAISKYLICEVKKERADVSHLEQLMKYVDWVAKEHAYGDYSMIKAYLVASSFSFNKTELEDKIERTFTVGTRPAVTKKWNNVELIDYRTILNKMK